MAADSADDLIGPEDIPLASFDLQVLFLVNIRRSDRPFIHCLALYRMMWGNLKEKGSNLFGSEQSSTPPPQSDRDQDLTTILDRSQRAELTLLVGEILAYMRNGIEEQFHKSAPVSDNQPHPQGGSDQAETSPKPTATDNNAENKDEESSTPPTQKLGELKLTTQDLKSEANSLSSFDDWRDAVILRIGEVVNKADEPGDSRSENTTSQGNRPLPTPPIEEDQGPLEKLRELYPPVDTPLANLPRAKKLLILHSLLLLLLSLEHYNARSRILMLYVSSSLGLDVKILNEDEVKVARGLLDTALQLSANGEGQAEGRTRDPTRKWKVGIASVVGATLIGITGGLAAPLVAAGLGTVMGGLGLGATAAAGYLGALAGSGVVVGGLFGAYGGRMTGRMVDKYAKEVDDFAFLPIRGTRRRLLNDKDAAQQDHRLRVTIGITGWVTEEENFVVPWRVLGPESEVFGLRWETEPLMDLGNAMDLLVTSAAYTAGEQVLKKTIFASLLSAVVLPLGLMKISRVASNPFSVAKARADKAGEVLADALISKVQGERSVTLMGYSLGSRVIFSCLQSLAKRNAYGLVESAILMGAPTPSDTEDWRRMRRVVSGRLVNAYSDNDTVLALLYRTTSMQLGVAGLQPVQGVVGVENLDVSDMISGHLRYQFMIGHILRRVGLESIDAREVAREEAALAAKAERQERERIRNARRAGVEPDGESAKRVLESGEQAEDEEVRLKREVAERTKERLPSRESDEVRPPLPPRKTED
ncbi:hypothetical protein ATERTT37_002605 [Aspergillus terreus]